MKPLNKFHYRATCDGYDSSEVIICATRFLAQKTICKMFYKNSLSYLTADSLQRIEIIKQRQTINSLLINNKYIEASKLIIAFNKDVNYWYSIKKETPITEINMDKSYISDEIFTDFFKKATFT